jgi:hypothetical protein
MLAALVVLLRSLRLICSGHRAVALENLALRQQLAVFRRTGRRVYEWPQPCSAGPDVLALSVGSNGDGAIGAANARWCQAARRSNHRSST